MKKRDRFVCQNKTKKKKTLPSFLLTVSVLKNTFAFIFNPIPTQFMDLCAKNFNFLA